MPNKAKKVKTEAKENPEAKMAKKAKKLREIAEVMEGHVIDEFEKVNVIVLRELVEEVSEMSDPRDGAYVRHKLSDVLMIILFAVMANANQWREIEEFGRKKENRLRTFLSLEHGVPTDDTYRIVASKVNVRYVYQLIIGFFIEKVTKILEISEKAKTDEEEEKEIISCDGKVSKSSKRNETAKEEVKSLNTLNAYSSEWGMCIDQEFIEEKSNEIPAMPKLLSRLNLEGTIVTWDALNTQKSTVEAVIKRKTGKGDYVGALKGNHGTLYEDTKDYFDKETKDKIRKEDQKRLKKQYIKTTEKEHSAIVTREYYIEPDIGWLYGREEWAGLKSIGVEIKKIEKIGNEADAVYEERYYICSVTDINDFARAVRGHWGVENGLHWHLDATLGDDKNTTTRDNGAEGMQIFKKIALALLKVAQVLYPPRTSLKMIRYKLSLDYENEIERIFTALDPDSVKALIAK